MEIRRAQPSELDLVHRLLADNGWGHRITDKHQFTQLIQASQIADVAFHEGQIVGFVRAITDGLSNGYLSMVVVHPAFRGQGIGRALVEHAMGTCPQVTWMLRAGRVGANEFFSKLGFGVSAMAMERPRARFK